MSCRPSLGHGTVQIGENWDFAPRLQRLARWNRQDLRPEQPLKLLQPIQAVQAEMSSESL